MELSQTLNPDPLLNNKEAAIYIGCRNGSTALLDKLRCYGGGPRFIKTGKTVKYRRSSLEMWLKERERVSTSDTGNAVASGV